MADVTISYKGNTISELNESGNKTLKTRGKYCEDDINIKYVKSSSGSSEVCTVSDVNFYDYDGTLLHAYTLEEAQQLTSLPELPTHEGLICQGWNWTLEQIKTENNRVNVGAMYITDDGKTRIYIHLEEGRTSPMLGLGVNGTVTVDWGDGTTSTLSGTDVSTTIFTDTHNYANAGDYVISLDVNGKACFSGNTNGTFILRFMSTNTGRNRVYANAIRKIEIGNNMNITNYAFYVCTSLSTITMTSSVTTIGVYTFYSCFNLVSLTIPPGVTRLYEYAFSRCRSLLNVSIPLSIKAFHPNSFIQCYSLSSINIPSGVTNISDSSFQQCYSLLSINIPSSVTRIGSDVFRECVSLLNIVLPAGLTIIGNNVFYSCQALTTINIPQGVTTIGESAFYNCNALSNITMPSTIAKIGGAAFGYCLALSNIVIPPEVIRFEYETFRSCFSVAYFDFSHHTSIPILATTNVFTDISPDCQIRVPLSLVDEWKSATNWSTYADYIVGV